MEQRDAALASRMKERKASIQYKLLVVGCW